MAGATFTTTQNRTLNQDRGQILVITAGPNAGTRYPIAENTAGPNSIYTISAALAVAPDATNVFDVRSRAGKETWSGEYVLDLPGGAIHDGLDFLPTGAGNFFTPVGTTLQESAVRFLTTAGTGFTINQQCSLESCISIALAGGPLLATSRLKWNPTGVTPCGGVLDGTAVAGNFGNNSSFLPARATYAMLYAKSWNITASPSVITFKSVTIFDDCFLRSVGMQILNCRNQNGRTVGGTLISVAGTNANYGCVINTLTFVTPTAGTLINVVFGGHLIATTVTGQATGGANVFLNVATGGHYVDFGANTAQGTVAGNDVTVDGGTPFAVTQLALLGVLSAQKSGGTWSSSIDNSAGAGSIADTVNRISGRNALAIASGAVFTINNSLLKALDDVYIQLIGPVTPAINPVVVVADGVAVITFAAAAAGTTQKFSWWVKKSTAT